MKKAVVLGGGSAGWLTALFLQKNYPGLDITVVEDPASPPILAGESGSASVNKLLNFLEIDMTEWIVSVNAMPKLGGKFTDWDGVGSEFVHGLIPDWYALDYTAKFPEFGNAKDFVACAVAQGVSQENIYYNAYLQKRGKVPITKSSDPTKLFNVLTMPMWHFDSRASAEYFKKIGLRRGIELVEGKYQTCIRNDNGSITSIQLDGERTITSDWFFDCSGFARLLLQNVIKEPLVDYSNYFPARAVAIWWDKPELLNYTGLHAMKYGWRWNINLQHRAGNGYIYNPDLISKEQAHAEIELTVGARVDIVANVQFTPSLTNNAWRHNVIAIGLSTGFLEPLESNGLASVVAQLQILSNWWNPESLTESTEQKKYNEEYRKTMDDIRDFLSLHYRGARRDTEFWIDHANNPARISNSLANRLELLKQGVLGVDDWRGYGLENYTTVVQGLNLVNIEKLRARLLAKRPTIFEDFNNSYIRLAKEVESIADLCYTTEQWKSMVYGQ
jgi:tryptophan halogenase